MILVAIVAEVMEEYTALLARVVEQVFRTAPVPRRIEMQRRSNGKKTLGKKAAEGPNIAAYALVGFVDIVRVLAISIYNKRSRQMTLLLGPPGSGKTTLLLALAGKLDPNLRASGKITYCGHELNEFVAAKTCAYISQHDILEKVSLISCKK